LNRLSPLEIASGLVFGLGPPERLPSAREAGTPLEAIERAILPALKRPPCLVSFSGGRDSSTILALAVRLARREGLELPIPATNRFPPAESSDDVEWQERVVVRLGLTEWIRAEYTNELDSVGPVARQVLRRHGLLWPFNAHFHAPLLHEAFGGSLLTGIGGDEALGRPRWARSAAVLSGRGCLRPRELLAVGLTASPFAVRRAAHSTREPVLLPWLRPEAQGEVWARWVADTASEPLRWSDRFAWWRRLRYVRLAIEALRLIGSDLLVEVRHPFADAGFASALAALPPDARAHGRSVAMRQLFDDALPHELIQRCTRSHFDLVFWNEHSRELAARWNGDGIDDELVDVEALRREWEEPCPDARTFMLLQELARSEEPGVAVELEQAVAGA
jgi:asparagine synthetase B (glutamine-hydrolysing)